MKNIFFCSFLFLTLSCSVAKTDSLNTSDNQITIFYHTDGRECESFVRKFKDASYIASFFDNEREVSSVQDPVTFDSSGGWEDVYKWLELNIVNSTGFFSMDRNIQNTTNRREREKLNAQAAFLDALLCGENYKVANLGFFCEFSGFAKEQNKGRKIKIGSTSQCWIIFLSDGDIGRYYLMSKKNKLPSIITDHLCEFSAEAE